YHSLHKLPYFANAFFGLMTTSMIRNLFKRVIERIRTLTRSPGHHSYNVFYIKQQYHSFKEVLYFNNEVLKLINELEDKLSGAELIGFNSIKNIVDKLTLSTFQLVKALNKMTQDRYKNLYNKLEEIDTRIQQELRTDKTSNVTELVIPYTNITRELIDAVGGKNATLGEIKNRIGVQVPDGFAITTHAYDLFIEHNNLKKKIHSALNMLDLKDHESIESTSKNIQELIINSEVPDSLIYAINNAYDTLTRSGNRDIYLAIRSSAINEDGILSFAGQYESMLNVPKDDIPNAYKRVIASLYSSSAIFYLAHKGLIGMEQKMGVGCMVMIHAKSAGIVYTRNPNDPQNNTILINAVIGLGKSAVDGTATPDIFFVDRDNGYIKDRQIARKSIMYTTRASGGIEKVVLQQDKHEPCLTDDQIHAITDAALKIERYFNTPQDIEWCIDEDNRLFVLQSRQLKFSSGVLQNKKRYNEYPVLLENGRVVCPGAGIGKAFVLKDEKDIMRIPAGSILVAPHPSPVLVKAMDKVNAIVTDTGGIAGHMASIAREFNIPTIADTGNATSVIKHGETITVDATSACVYSGVVKELAGPKPVRAGLLKDTPVYELLKRVSKYIVPLNLTDPSDDRFDPAFCETIHDITRYCHEQAISHMFNVGDNVPGGINLIKMGMILPIDLHIIDIGDGLKEGLRKNVIEVEDIASVPFYAFMKGFTHPEIKWWEPRRIDVKGFFSVLTSSATRIKEYEKPIGEKSYAIISRDYFNFNSRVGYHFSTIDAYCDDIKENNYITFYFQGGASEDIRRFRRAKFIAGVLNALQFTTDTKGDRVMAYIRKYEKSAIQEKLDILGRLMLCSLHLDMLMTSDKSVEWFVDAFLKGNYNFEI
ncbi:MAG: PEP/pyruvate-binding domain-containing protein, partial [bacterium]